MAAPCLAVLALLAVGPSPAGAVVAEAPLVQVQIQVKIVEVSTSVLEQIGLPRGASWAVLDVPGFANVDQAEPGLRDDVFEQDIEVYFTGSKLMSSGFNFSEIPGEIDGQTTTEIKAEGGFLVLGDDGTFRTENFLLGVTIGPKILETGMIGSSLNIDRTVIDAAGMVTQQTISLPAEVKPGGLIVFGGLFQQDLPKIDDKFPGIRDVPFLGQLFKSERYQKGESEVILLIRPYLVGEPLLVEESTSVADEPEEPLQVQIEQKVVLLEPLAPKLGYGTWQFALTPGYTFGSIGTRQHTSFSGEAKGENISYGAFNFHADARYILGEKDKANIGNVGNVGSMSKLLVPWEPFVGMKGSLTAGGGDEGLKKRNHPPFGDPDTFINYRIGGSFTPYIGIKAAEWDWGSLNVLGGPRFTFAEIEAETDETGGGGVQEKFSKSTVQVGPAVGFEIDVPMDSEYYGGLQGGIRFAAWGEYLPGAEVSGESSTFGFDYNFATDGAFLGTFRFGVFINLGQY